MAPHRLRDRLRHILAAINAIEMYTRAIDEKAFLTDSLRIDAGCKVAGLDIDHTRRFLHLNILERVALPLKASKIA